LLRTQRGAVLGKGAVIAIGQVGAAQFTAEFMTARWARLPYEFLDRVSHRLINEVAGISRVVFGISCKSPPATIEWE